MQTQQQTLSEFWNEHTGQQTPRAFMAESRNRLGADVTIEQAVRDYVGAYHQDYLARRDLWAEGIEDEGERDAFLARNPALDVEAIVRGLVYHLEATHGEEWE